MIAILPETSATKLVAVTIFGFTVPTTRSSSSRALALTTLLLIIAGAETLQADYRTAFRNAMNAYSRGRWGETEDNLRHAIAENSLESSERINIYGTYYERYTPHLFRGVALARLGVRCDEARREFAISQAQGAIKPADVVIMTKERNGCGPIAMASGANGTVYILSANGVVSYDGHGPPKVVVKASPDFRPADIASLLLSGTEYIFVSGFLGRRGIVQGYQARGGLWITLDTPELAAGITIDRTTHQIYVASAVANSVYAIQTIALRQQPRLITYIKEAGALGPLAFDSVRQKAIVSDVERGTLYDVDIATGKSAVLATDLGMPRSITVNATLRTLYVGDSRTGDIYSFLLDDIRRPWRRSALVHTGLHKLSAIAVAPNNDLYVADGENGLYVVSLKTGTTSLSR